MATLLLILAGGYLIAGIIFFGKRVDSYSHIKNTISELGECGSPQERIVSFGLFFPIGLALILISLLSDSNHSLQGLSLCVGVGYLVAAFFSCDKGSPLEGSWRQQVHNLGGFVEYAGGAYFIYNAASSLSSVSSELVAGAIIFCVILLSIPSLPVRGLMQRVAESLLFFAMAVLTFHH